MARVGQVAGLGWELCKALSYNVKVFPTDFRPSSDACSFLL
jgi:hypothetical protein